jgi:exopolysaccharide production protein ExoZ
VVAQGLLDTGILRRLAVWPLAWLVVFLAAWHWLSADQSPFFPEMSAWSWTYHWPLGLLAFAAMTLCIAGIARGRGLFCSFLRNPPMQWLGTISYSLYLWHLIVLGVIKFGMAQSGLTSWAGGGAQVVLLILALPISLAVANISQILLEQHLTRWLRQHWQTSPKPALT